MTMLTLFAALAAVFLVAERLFPAREQALLRRGFFADLAYVPIHFLMRVILNGTLAVALTRLAREALPSGTIAILSASSLWLQVAAVLLVLDFFFYWMHRAKHQWNWWWRLHETHHSSEDLDWLSTVRFHPLEKALDRLVYLLPLLVLGVSDEALLVLAGVDAFCGMMIHSNLPIRLGPLIYVLNGPEMHGWHHAPDADQQRHNFGNNLSVFDWIFGTARVQPGMPERFGTGEPGYPHDNLAKQFVHAFRPWNPAEARD